MMRAEHMYARHLLTELESRSVPGAIVEFGVFTGSWLQTLADIREDLGSSREIWGFDSFEGLPATTEHDLSCWKRGDYAADFGTVSRLLKADERDWLKLRKGWFSETLLLSSELDSIAYARIDCDLYEPAVECLDFLTNRLSNGAILVFDDWTHNPSKGETKAFFEWAARAPELSFQFLAANSISHFYFRVGRKS